MCGAGLWLRRRCAGPFWAGLATDLTGGQVFCSCCAWMLLYEMSERGHTHARGGYQQSAPPNPRTRLTLLFQHTLLIPQPSKLNLSAQQRTSHPTMCPTPIAALAATAIEPSFSSSSKQQQPEQPASKPPAVPTTERANNEAEEAEGEAEAPVKLSTLSGTPAIIDALNAQTRRRAKRELEERGMGEEHPDYWCFRLVQEGAPGTCSSGLCGGFGRTTGHHGLHA